MSGTAETVLIVGGFAVGGFILIKILSPKPAVTGRTVPSSSATGFISGIVSPLVSLFTAARASQNSPGAYAPISSGGYVPPDAYYSSEATQAYAAEGDDSQGALNGPFI